MLVAGLLLPEDLGRIKVLQTFVDVASIIGGGGLIVAILKIVPESPDYSIRNYVLRYVLKNVLLFSTIVFVALNILAIFQLLSTDNLINQYFHLFSTIILISPISLVMVRYYQARELFKKVSIIQFITKFVSVSLIFFLTYTFSTQGYLSAVVLGFFISGIYLLIDLRKHIFVKPNMKQEIKGLKQRINHLSKFNFYGQVSDQLRIYSTFFVANYLILDREVFGQYSFALILIQGFGILSSSIQQFVIPKFSKDSGKGVIFFTNLFRYEKQYFLVSIIVFVLAQLIVPEAILLIFGEKYEQSIPIFRVLLIGWLIYCGFTLKGPAFIGLGRLEISFKISFYVLLLSVPLAILLGSFWGIWGIVVSYVIQTFCSFILSNYFMISLKNNSQ